MSIANPTVNRYLADKAMDRIDHALGRPIWPLRETYRNHYATNAGGPLGMVASPFWSKSGQQGDMAFYAVTEAGRIALDIYLEDIESPWRPFVVSFGGFSRIIPERSRSKAKYAYYLAVSDAWSDLTFAEFCKTATARSAS